MDRKPDHTMLKASTTMNFLCLWLWPQGHRNGWCSHEKKIWALTYQQSKYWFKRCIYYFEVPRVSNRLIIVKLIVSQRVVTFLSVYAPQSGLSDDLRTCFLISCMLWLPRSQHQISVPMCRLEQPCRLCRHWKQRSAWWDGRREPDVEGERTLE